MGSWVVLKFGGTSVSTRERWDTIAQVVRERMDEGVRPLVVCSAVSGISRALERLMRQAVSGEHALVLEEIRARHRQLAADLGVDADALLGDLFSDLDRFSHGVSLTEEASPRLRARVLAAGELMLTRLGAAFLETQRLHPQWCDAREMLQSTDVPRHLEHRRYLSAICDVAPDPALQAKLAAMDTDLWLTQGFIARDAAGDTVLLGWGGSDTSAAYFAAKLQAQRLEIWTDVPGMFTANPQAIPTARHLRYLGCDEAQELASTGAEVLHPRSIAPVQQQGIPLHIRSTQAPHLEGTIVSDELADSTGRIKAVSPRTGLTLIAIETPDMWQQVGFLARVFALFKDYNLSVDLVATSEASLTVALDPTADPVDPATMRSLRRDLKKLGSVRTIGPCAAISLVGRGIRAALPQLGPALVIFEEHTVHLMTQDASNLNLTFVVDEADAGDVTRKLHAQLFETWETGHLFGPTWHELFSGESGTEAPKPWWRTRRAELLALAESGSPRYVYDEATLRGAAERMQAIDPVDRVFYAMKANPHPDVLRVFYEMGLGFECVSPGEIRHVQKHFSDISPDRILFTPNFAHRDEYAFGFEAGAHVTLDNLYPLEAWPEVFAGQDLLVRFDTGHRHGHHKYVRTAGVQSKFGVSAAQAQQVLALAGEAGARIVGLHAHDGSGVTDPNRWAETATFLAELATQFPDVHLLNIGGGLGVPDRPSAESLDVAALAASLAPIKAAHPHLELWMEPGRYLVAEAGVLLARVTQVKQKESVHYIGLDTGMNSLIRPALYSAYHDIANLTRLDEPATRIAEVVGPICESGDVLGHDCSLPETQEGDVLLIATAGAYGHAMSSTYNLRPPAEEVVLQREAVRAG